MTPTREIRPSAKGTDQVLDSGSTPPIISAPARTTAEPALLIGHTVEKALDAALWRLRKDEISLDDLTPALAGFYLAGHAAALASVLPELTRTEIERDQAVSDRDRYYRAAFSPRDSIRVGPSYAELEKTRHEMYSGGAK